MGRLAGRFGGGWRLTRVEWERRWERRCDSLGGGSELAGRVGRRFGH